MKVFPESNKIIFRNSAKAIIVKDGKLLLLQKQHPGNPAFTVFPGGGQEPGESLSEALERECREEIGAIVKVEKLLFIREYRSWEQEFHNPARLMHQVEFFFECNLLEDLREDLVDNPDPGQIGALWVPINALTEANLYPKMLRELLPKKLQEEPSSTVPVYLGCVN
jgi:8-oxo-dGTP pyrophosphatase MutT (NUDIX family)